MRPLWKGQISFGLINIPIELYSAEKKKEIQFKLLDSRNNAKIHYERINEKTGETVPWNNIVKAYELSKKNYVILDENDFNQAAIENTQTFEIEDFVEQKSIDCSLFEKPYFLVPTKNAQKGYVLLREILKKTGKVAIGKVVIRTRQYLAALLPKENILLLNVMRFADEIRDVSELAIPKGDLKEYKISKKEFDMAEKLVESMTAKWDPTKYSDDYKESLMKWIEKKAKQDNIPLPAAKPEIHKDNVVDFMELLKKSLQKKTKKGMSPINNRSTKPTIKQKRVSKSKGVK